MAIKTAHDTPAPPPFLWKIRNTKTTTKLNEGKKRLPPPETKKSRPLLVFLTWESYAWKLSGTLSDNARVYSWWAAQKNRSLRSLKTNVGVSWGVCFFFLSRPPLPASPPFNHYYFWVGYLPPPLGVFIIV